MNESDFILNSSYLLARAFVVVMENVNFQVNEYKEHCAVNTSNRDDVFSRDSQLLIENSYHTCYHFEDKSICGSPK